MNAPVINTKSLSDYDLGWQDCANNEAVKNGMPSKYYEGYSDRFQQEKGELKRERNI